MNKPLSLTLAALATTTLFTASIAVAQPGMHRGDMTRADVETRTTAAFERLDANDDGVLNEDDRAARQAKTFDRIDENGDGSISREEFASARGKMHEMRGEGRRGGKHRMGHRGHRGAGMMRHMAQMADTNGDGAISQEEFTAAALARFDNADANNDGTVTPDERKAAHQKMREARRAAAAS